MKIGIEAQRIFRTKKHGMDYVALETIRELQKLDIENEYFIFVAPGDDKCLAETSNFKIIEVKCPSYPLWEQLALPLAVRKLRIDVLHCTSNTAPIFLNVPLILTLHDIIFLEPKHYANKSTYQNLGRIYRRFVVPKILHKCRKIITVSNFERDNIIDTLKLDSNKIVSIYNGYNRYFKKITDVRIVVNRYIKSEDYIFFIGNTDPKKNLNGTLRAYSIYLKSSVKKLPLLLGDLKEEHLVDVLKAENIEFVRDKIKLSGYIKNTDLPAIYNGAKMFLYTSFRESFGIPLLEAMSCGTPVITGNSSALPEIAGEGAILVDVSDPYAIAAKMINLENDINFYESQVRYGLERVKKFSWHDTAKKLYNLYITKV